MKRQIYRCQWFVGLDYAKGVMLFIMIAIAPHILNRFFEPSRTYATLFVERHDLEIGRGSDEIVFAPGTNFDIKTEITGISVAGER